MSQTGAVSKPCLSSREVCCQFILFEHKPLEMEMVLPPSPRPRQLVLAISKSRVANPSHRGGDEQIPENSELHGCHRSRAAAVVQVGQLFLLTEEEEVSRVLRASCVGSSLGTLVSWGWSGNGSWEEVCSESSGRWSSPATPPESFPPLSTLTSWPTLAPGGGSLIFFESNNWQPLCWLGPPSLAGISLKGTQLRDEETPSGPQVAQAVSRAHVAG